MEGLPTSIADMEQHTPYDDRLKAKAYESELRILQIELLKLQASVRAEGRRIVILFEGRDAAGKGGSIKRFTENLNPRGGRVVALTKPNETERGQWYFQRYVTHLPTAGEIVMFDRSWYNRAGVERVMGFCTPREYMEFMRQAPGFERSLVNSGTHLFKLWFAVSEDEQRERFAARRSDPLRRWKLSPIDEASLGRFHDYTEARNAMFFYTDTPEAPVDGRELQREAPGPARVDPGRAPLPRLRPQGRRRGRTGPTRWWSGGPPSWRSPPTRARWRSPADRRPDDAGAERAGHPRRRTPVGPTCHRGGGRRRSARAELAGTLRRHRHRAGLGDRRLRGRERPARLAALAGVAGDAARQLLDGPRQRGRGVRV